MLSTDAQQSRGAIDLLESILGRTQGDDAQLRTLQEFISGVLELPMDVHVVGEPLSLLAVRYVRREPAPGLESVVCVRIRGTLDMVTAPRAPERTLLIAKHRCRHPHEFVNLRLEHAGSELAVDGVDREEDNVSHLSAPAGRSRDGVAQAAIQLEVEDHQVVHDGRAKHLGTACSGRDSMPKSLEALHEFLEQVFVAVRDQNCGHSH